MIFWRSTILLSIALCQLAAADRYKRIPGVHTFEEAERKCEELGESWGLPDDQQDSHDLVRYLQTQRLGSIWLGIKAEKRPAWKWINNKTIESTDGDIAPVGQEVESRCGILTLQHSVYKSVPCSGSNTRLGFVCEIHDGLAGTDGKCSRCPEKHYKQACIKHGTSCFIIGCHAPSWMEARKHCRSIGAEMAIIDSPEKKKAIKAYIEVVSDTTGVIRVKCDWLSVGLVHQKWTTTKPFNDGELPRERWPKDYVAGQNESCVQLNVVQNVSKWHTADCDTNQSTVCQNYGALAENCLSTTKYNFTDMNNTTKNCTLLDRQPFPIDQEKETYISTGMKAALGVVMVLLILLVLLIIRIRFVHWSSGESCQHDIELLIPYPGRKAERQKEQVGNNQNDENANEKPWSELILPCDYASVVLFKDVLENGHCSITVKHYEDLPRHSFEQSVCDCLKWAVEQIFQFSDETVARMRIITINCLDQGRLDEDAAESVLSNLNTILARVQVIVLPDIIVNKTEKAVLIVEKLRFARERTVIIKETTDPFDLFSNEAITVQTRSTQQENNCCHTDFEIINDVNQTRHSAFAQALGYLAAIYNAVFMKGINDEERVWNTSLIRKLLCHIITSDNKRNQRPRPNCRIVEGPWDTSNLQQDQKHITKRYLRLQKKRNIRREPLSATEQQNQPLSSGKIQIVFIQKDTDGFRREVEIKVASSDEQTLNKARGFRTFLRALKLCCKENELAMVTLEIIYKKATNWEEIDESVKQLDKPCIVHMETNIGIPPHGHTVLQRTKELTYKSTVISSAFFTQDYRIAFPNFFSISVGTQEDRDIDDRDIEVVDETLGMPLLGFNRHLTLCGSCLDFQCQAGNLEEEKNAAWVASYFVTGVVASLFVRATVLGVKQERIERLKQTHVIHSILQRYCQNEQHSVTEGWGPINVGDIRSITDDHLRDLIYHFTNPNRAPRNYWNGKNI